MSDFATPATHHTHVAAYYRRQSNLADMFAMQRKLASDHAGYVTANRDSKRYARLAHEAA